MQPLLIDAQALEETSTTPDQIFRVLREIEGSEDVIVAWDRDVAPHLLERDLSPRTLHQSDDDSDAGWPAFIASIRVYFAPSDGYIKAGAVWKRDHSRWYFVYDPGAWALEKAIRAVEAEMAGRAVQ